MKFEEDYFRSIYGGEYLKRNPPRKLEYYLKQILAIKPSGSLLDIGCAYGLFLSNAGKYYNVTGCDVSGHAVSEAKRLFPDINIVKAGIETLDMDRTFDIITCFDILEHVENIENAFRKIRELLCKDGIIVISVPVYDTIPGIIGRALDKDKTHIWRKGRDFWKKKMQEQGFVLLKDIGLWRYFFLSRYYMFWGGRIWRDFSPAILLIAQKRDL